MSKVQITDLILRDAHQSLLATRMKTEDMLPIAEKLDRVGYWSLETWGGATYDSCLRFLREDPWERIRVLKEAMPRTPMQMLLRGQNILGYRHYADDVVERFVEKAHSNGVDVFRIFDALNDPRNLKTAINKTNEVGGHVESVISYTISPFHSNEKFVELGEELVSMGADSICIKDMAGLMMPQAGYELVSALKEKIDVPIHIHTHYTSGAASATLIKCIEAGAEIVDTGISSMSMGTAHPPTETIVAALKGTKWDTGLNLPLLTEIANYFKEVRKKYAEFESPFSGVDSNVLAWQIPGGMMSNLSSQLKEAGMLNKMDDVLAEVPRVREDMGYPPLVTPSSQIVGTQAVMNVIAGERYKMVPEESYNVFKGMYGSTPAPISEEARAKVLKGEEAVTCRPADLIANEFEERKAELLEWWDTMESQPDEVPDEDVLSFSLFPDVAKDFFSLRAGLVAPPPGPPEPPADAYSFDLGLGGDGHEVLVDPASLDMAEAGGKVSVWIDGDHSEVDITSLPAFAAVPTTNAPKKARRTTVSAQPKDAPSAATPVGEGVVTPPMPGKVVKILKTEGDAVVAGEAVLVLEAMKMENEVAAPMDGVVAQIPVSPQQMVAQNDVLFVVE